MMARFRFEELTVWQKSIEYADGIYEATTHFPDDERFGLTNQLRRASVSVSSNIAEGHGRSTNREYVRFVEIAYASLMETVSQLHLAHRRKYIKEDYFENLLYIAEEIARMLSGLRKSLTKN